MTRAENYHEFFVRELSESCQIIVKHRAGRRRIFDNVKIYRTRES